MKWDYQIVQTQNLLAFEGRLQWLGSEGWELVSASVSVVHAIEVHYAYLKRAISGDGDSTPMSRNLSILANVRCAIDVLRGRMPGALAMLRAEDIAISVHHNDERNNHWCRVDFWFRDGADASRAYRAVEHIYEMNRAAVPATNREGEKL